jgi:hypothetical protein
MYTSGEFQKELLKKPAIQAVKFSGITRAFGMNNQDLENEREKLFTGDEILQS